MLTNFQQPLQISPVIFSVDYQLWHFI